MSQIVMRKSATPDEKEKSRNASPVPDMKKKLAANAEKEKLAAEKQNGDKEDNVNEKLTREKVAAVKKAEKKTAKVAKKNTTEKIKEKSSAEKPMEKKAEETQEEGSSKGDNSGSNEPKETPKKTDKKDQTEEPKQNGNKPHNGVSDVTLSSNDGTEEVLKEVMVSEDSDGLLISLLRELGDPLTEQIYEELLKFELPALTAISQPKETKVLKSSSARNLLLTDSPKKTTEEPQDSPKVTVEPQDSPKVTDSPKKSAEKTETPKNVDKEMMLDAIEIIEIEDCGSTLDGEARKPETNFSKSRVMVSPYRRSTRLADQTTSSVLANYTGNNTTMEMDITESSIVEDSPVAEQSSSYINAIRNIRGRKSYKNLQELDQRSVSIERAKRNFTAKLSASEQPSRPTSIVVGRKRKPEAEEAVLEAELATEAMEMPTDTAAPTAAQPKRKRLLDKFVSPFRRVASSTPLPQRRAAPIVGINSDLPRSVPVPSGDLFEMKSFKDLPAASTSVSVPTESAPTEPAPTEPAQTEPALYVPAAHEKNTRCVVM